MHHECDLQSSRRYNRRHGVKNAPVFSPDCHGLSRSCCWYCKFVNSACLSAACLVSHSLHFIPRYLYGMIIRRIVLVWLALSTLGTLITYFAHSGYNDKWLIVVQAIAISMFVLPVVFLITALYLRYFKASRKWLREFISANDNSRSEG